MHRTLVPCLLLVASCAAGSASTDPSSPPAGTAAPSDVPECAGQPCALPARCIDVVGMQPESAHKECWITCSKDSDCPSDKKCTMIHDGPGQVCD